MITMPKLLDMPEKLFPILERFNDYKIFVIEGGRGSGKSNAVARILLYLANRQNVRVFCGREIQSTIDESVYTLLLDLIGKFQLPYRPTKVVLRSLNTESSFRFKGFREQGRINIKGIEGADIVWVDEAQSLTKPTLEVMIPTLRKETPVKFFFTMNRLHRDDAVMDLTTRDDCLHIHIDYFENEFCPPTLLHEAEMCRINSPREYNHIWLGQPASAGDEFLFDFDKLYEAQGRLPFGDLLLRQRIMGIDFAAQGNDYCVATFLDRLSSQHWGIHDQIKWDQPDTTQSVGRIINLIGQYKPDVIVLDVGGAGWNVYCDLINAQVKNVFPFNGGSTEGISPMSFNARADGYWILRDWFGAGFLCIGEQYRDTLKQLERIKQKWRVDGKRQLRLKHEMKQEEGYSPDEADSLMMAVWGAAKHLSKSLTSNQPHNGVRRISGSKRKR